MGRLSTTSGLAAGEDDADFVRALARGLALLECFDAEHGAMTLTEIAERVELSRGSTRRLLLTLEHLGYLGSDGTRFFPRSRVLKLGYGYLSLLPVWTAARTYLAEVARHTNESCSVAVLDQFDIVYVARHAAKRILHDYIPIGTRYPAHSTSMGKVLLAGLAEDSLSAHLPKGALPQLTPKTITIPAEFRRELMRTRERGFAINDEEIEIGLRSIAVPIRDGKGAVCAAINISAPAARVSVEQLKDWLPTLRQASEAITLLMTHR
ncbi:MAG TPA: IclR family transcriptional regulator C-terminal domain-containing protein [Pseudolabrys sp.]|nr:IclR family transcriptional regulator C-terminal domain-containing protein [Pseudolabrys sp.]